MVDEVIEHVQVVAAYIDPAHVWAGVITILFGFAFPGALLYGIYTLVANFLEGLTGKVLSGKGLGILKWSLWSVWSVFALFLWWGLDGSLTTALQVTALIAAGVVLEWLWRASWRYHTVARTA